MVCALLCDLMKEGMRVDASLERGRNGGKSPRGHPLHAEGVVHFPSSPAKGSWMDPDVEDFSLRPGRAAANPCLLLPRYPVPFISWLVPRTHSQVHFPRASGPILFVRPLAHQNGEAVHLNLNAFCCRHLCPTVSSPSGFLCRLLNCNLFGSETGLLLLSQQATRLANSKVQITNLSFKWIAGSLVSLGDFVIVLWRDVSVFYFYQSQLQPFFSNSYHFIDWM